MGRKVVGSYPVRVRGHLVDVIVAKEARGWTEDAPTYRFNVVGDDIDDGCDRTDDARSMIADAIREARGAFIDTQRDNDNDALAAALDAITDAGKAADALAALKAAGLI